ncbi:MAG TPA: hypothetical protein VGP93_10960 [Polyangiaceae bacterium]|nr:hypothetical protein [Polyangiaceae bacterium]
MNRQRAGLLASDPAVTEPAQAELAASDSAVAAVIAGYFVAVGLHPGVLLAPLTLLVAGVGQGGRAFDGRCLQPGRGAKRPRGLLPNAEVPPSGRAALSTSVAALAVALAYDAELSLAPLLRSGIHAAEKADASSRASLLSRIAAVGPAALTEPSFVQTILRVASASQGGLLTPADFAPPKTLDQLTVERPLGRAIWLEAPWASEPSAPDSEHGAGHAIIAIDAQGRFAALAYRILDTGLFVSELGVTAPFAAVPVRRGIPRIAPGRRLPCPAPIAFVRQASSIVSVLAEPRAARLGKSVSRQRLSLGRDPRSRLVTSGGA